MLPNANYSSHVDLSEELFFQLEPLEYFLHPFLLLHPWPLLLGPSNVEVKPKTYRSKKWDSWKLWILSTELMTNLERWMGPNCKSDLWFSYMLLQVYWFLLKDLHLFLQLWVLQYNALSLCVFALVTKILMPSPQIHTFLTHLAILWALSGSETLHIVGQPSVNAQALTLENCLDAVGMDVSNSGCVSRKGSRQMQREEHANKCWKAAGCQMWAYRAWCFKKCWNVLLYSNFLCFEIFFFFFEVVMALETVVMMSLERNIVWVQSSISENFETWIIFFWENFQCQLCFKRIVETACPSSFSLFQLIK